MYVHNVQRNLEAAGISGVRDSVTLINCLQEPDCEAVSLSVIAMNYNVVISLFYYFVFSRSYCYTV